MGNNFRLYQNYVNGIRYTYETGNNFRLYQNYVNGVRYTYETLFLVFLLYESLERLEIKKNIRS